MTTQDRIIEIISDHLGITPSEVLPSSTFQELGCDSLDEVELAMEIEEEFNIDLPDDLFLSNKSVEEALKEIEECLALKTSPP